MHGLGMRLPIRKLTVPNWSMHSIYNVFRFILHERRSPAEKWERKVGRGRIKLCLRRFGHIHRNCAIITGTSSMTTSLQSRTRRQVHWHRSTIVQVPISWITRRRTKFQPSAGNISWRHRRRFGHILHNDRWNVCHIQYFRDTED